MLLISVRLFTPCVQSVTSITSPTLTYLTVSFFVRKHIYRFKVIHLLGIRSEKRNLVAAVKEKSEL